MDAGSSGGICRIPREYQSTPRECSSFPLNSHGIIEKLCFYAASGSRRMRIDEDLMNRLPNPLEFFAGCNDRR